MDEQDNLIEQETGCEIRLNLAGEIQLTGFGDLSQREMKKLV
jgi:hypothetical protein